MTTRLALEELAHLRLGAPEVGSQQRFERLRDAVVDYVATRRVLLRLGLGVDAFPEEPELDPDIVDIVELAVSIQIQVAAMLVVLRIEISATSYHQEGALA